MKQLHSRCLLEDSFNSAHNITNLVIIILSKVGFWFCLLLVYDKEPVFTSALFICG